MTEKCFDIGTIQAFLDGELAFEMTEAVARHVAICDDCAITLATAEEESAFAFTALEQEFNTLVPTQRLWTKINDSIEREKKPFWKPIFAFLLRPSTAAFASLLFVAVVSISLLSLKPNAPSGYVAVNNVKEPVINQTTVANQPKLNNQNPPVVNVEPVLPVQPNIESANHRQEKSEVRPTKAVYVKPENNRTAINPSPIDEDTSVPIRRENVLGEESYLKTIATLSQNVNSRKDEVLNSSERFAYERDLAVTNNAIEQMRKEVKRNPSNEAAKQILRTSYQNKIDLLNSVADKTELMASLK